MNKFFMIVCVCLSFSFVDFSASNKENIPENRGCCSWHGGVCGCAGGNARCCDGTISSCDC